MSIDYERKPDSFGDPMMAGPPVMTKRWAPPANVTDHYGNQIPPNMEFFAEPPPHIGELWTAASNLTPDAQPMAMPIRLVLTLAFGGGLLAAGVGAGIAFDWEPQAGWIVGGIAGLIAAGLTYWLTSFEHMCNFVGPSGAARFWCSGDRDNVTGEEFLFANAAELRTDLTHHYKNGVYQNTAYSFDWTNPAGISVYNISGSHGYENAPTPVDDDFTYAQAVENAWTEYLKPIAVGEIQQGRPWQFNLYGGDFVRVGEGYAEFNIGGVMERVRSEDIESATAQAGTLAIRRRGAVEGWFSSEGIFQFGYAELANAGLFLIVFSYLVKEIY